MNFFIAFRLADRLGLSKMRVGKSSACVVQNESAGGYRRINGRDIDARDQGDGAQR